MTIKPGRALHLLYATPSACHTIPVHHAADYVNNAGLDGAMNGAMNGAMHGTVQVHGALGTCVVSGKLVR